METLHTFHIPVMGLAYTIDTPVRVAHLGIDSTLSVMDDHLVEKMRAHYCGLYNKTYHAIGEQEFDSRARRITAYLDLLEDITEEEFVRVKNSWDIQESSFHRYFELLPPECELAAIYDQWKMLKKGEAEFGFLLKKLQFGMRKGAIHVNIMTKIDGDQDDRGAYSPASENSLALSALRGYVKSRAKGSVVFSAGFNPRLMSYLEKFADVFPDEKGKVLKQVILKVSDYRSALIQGKFLAKKGILVSEFRIESGINCGGHAFPNSGLLMAQVLEDFKVQWEAIHNSLLSLSNYTLVSKGLNKYPDNYFIRLTVQGGIGTYDEHRFLLENYPVNSVGWGSPFLLVPEAVNIDPETLLSLSENMPGDIYLSNSSPLGVPFYNFRLSSSIAQLKDRIVKERPGSPCVKKFLASNNEFGGKFICTASREYQEKKIRQLKEQTLPDAQWTSKLEEIIEKECLCEGLTNPALLNSGLLHKSRPKGVTVCPGPNLVNFNGIYSLKEMVDHIYGKMLLPLRADRKHFWIQEATLYLNYWKNGLQNGLDDIKSKWADLADQYLDGLDLIQGKLTEVANLYHWNIESLTNDLNELRSRMAELIFLEKKEKEGLHL